MPEEWMDMWRDNTRSIWKRDGFSTMNILTSEQFPPFEGDSYIFPTHKPPPQLQT